MLNYQPENYNRLHELFDVVELKMPSEDTPQILKDVEIGFAPLGYRYDKQKIDQMPKLKIIASNTTGEPHIDRAYAESRGIAVCSLMREQAFLATITPTAEHAWGLLLALLRRTPWAFEAVLRGEWNRWEWGAPSMLSRMNMGIAGFGRLGSLVGEYAHAFKMPRIRYYDPHIENAPAWAEKVSTLEKLVEDSDIISIHISSTQETYKIFSRTVLNKTKRGCFIINTARGELVDEDALIDLLESGHLGGAAYDVFDGEYEEDKSARLAQSRLLAYAKTHDNVLMTPHIGGSTRDAWSETEKHTIELIVETLRQDKLQSG